MDKKLPPLNYEPYRGAMNYIGVSSNGNSKWYERVGSWIVKLGYLGLLGVVIYFIYLLVNIPPSEIRLQDINTPFSACSVSNEVRIDPNTFVNKSSIKVGKISKISFTIDKSKRDPKYGNTLAFGVANDKNPTAVFNVVVENDGYYLGRSENNGNQYRIPITNKEGKKINPSRINIAIDATKGEIYFEGIGKASIPLFIPSLFSKVPDKIWVVNTPRLVEISNLRIC